MRLLPCGDNAVMLDCADAAEARLWARRLEAHVSLTLGARTVLVQANRSETQRLMADLESTTEGAGLSEARHHVISVHYNGPDLERVAEHTGLEPEAVITAHTATSLTVGFSGFAPGFAYLVDGDQRLEVPRLEVPRPKVDAGSVALAGVFSGIYPRESAGGWLIIGHTDEWLWDLDRDEPSRLRPGDTVTFEAIS